MREEVASGDDGELLRSEKISADPSKSMFGGGEEKGQEGRSRAFPKKEKMPGSSSPLEFFL